MRQALLLYPFHRQENQGQGLNNLSKCQAQDSKPGSLMSPCSILLHCTLYTKKSAWKLHPTMVRAVILVLFTTPPLKGVENLEQVQRHIMKIINV